MAREGIFSFVDDGRAGGFVAEEVSLRRESGIGGDAVRPRAERCDREREVGLRKLLDITAFVRYNLDRHISYLLLMMVMFTSLATIIFCSFFCLAHLAVLQKINEF